MTRDRQAKKPAADSPAAGPDRVLRELDAVEQKADTGPRRVEPADDGKRSQATRLVQIASESYRLIVGQDGRCYAVDDGGPAVAVPLRGRDGLRTRLARTYYARTGAAPSASALVDALAVIEGMAGDSPPVPVALRVARHRGQIVLDLADPTGRAVIVTADGWALAETSPVLFRRTALTHPLPVPEPGAGEGWTSCGGC